MTDLTKIARIFLTGTCMYPADIAATVAIDRVPGLSGDQAEITIGYDADGCRKITAQMLLPSVEAATEMLADCERMGAFVRQGVAAMPGSHRPALSEIIPGLAEMMRQEQMRARVQTVSQAAADANNLPWAA